MSLIFKWISYEQNEILLLVKNDLSLSLSSVVRRGYYVSINDESMIVQSFEGFDLVTQDCIQCHQHVYIAIPKT